MTDAMTLVKDAVSLQKAIHQEASHIEVEGRISDLSSLTLPAGTNLRGANANAELHFKEGSLD